MPRVVDFRCEKCDITLVDRLVKGTNDIKVICLGCGQEAQEIWWNNRKRDRTQWDDHDAVVVFRKPDGSIKYPGRNDVPTPKGCERVVMRSIREVERFEREHHVRNEAIWFDRGSGTKRPDDTYRGENFS